MSSPPLVNLPKLNYPLFVFIASMTALGFGEANKLCTLSIFGAIGSAISLLSLIVCLYSYTRHYWLHTKNVKREKALDKEKEKIEY